MSSPERPAATTQRIAEMRLRAMSQVSHFGTSANGGATFCNRCGKPLNRWDEKCDYQPDLAHLLAEDVLWLLDQPVVRALA